MRRLVLSVVIGAVAFCVFLYARPLLTIRVLAKSLKESDSEAIRERMDFERVRHALRDEFVARLGVDPDEASESAASVVTLALFGRGIEMIIATVYSENAGNGEGGPAKITHWEYDTTSRFHATLQRETGTPITLVLQRQGTSWQVTAMKPAESAWREFELYREGLTAEAETNLEAIFVKLADRHASLQPHDPKVIRLPRTPRDPPCGEPYTWTGDDLATWEVIGFSPSGPVNYSYSVSAGPDVGIDQGDAMMVAEAASDLDCDGTISRFSLPVGENPGGVLYRVTGIVAEQRNE